MKKETMLNNLDQEIEYFKKYIEDLEDCKNHLIEERLDELDDDFETEFDISSRLDDNHKLLCVYNFPSQYQLVFSKHCVISSMAILKK